MERTLARRAAREFAIREIQGSFIGEDEEEELDLPPNIQEDDVAEQHSQPCVAEEAEGRSSEILDDINDEFDAAEEWMDHLISDSADEDLDETDAANMTSKDGTTWSSRISNEGRLPQRNVLTERPGFKRGFHPQTRMVAFLVIFEDIMESAIQYTNLSGRRLSRAKGFQWRATDTEEFSAFLGLHMLAGRVKSHKANVILIQIA